MVGHVVSNVGKSVTRVTFQERKSVYKVSDTLLKSKLTSQEEVSTV